MRTELKNWIVFLLVAGIVAYAMFGRLAHGGAPIPPYPPPIVGVDRVRVQQACLLTYTRRKVFYCDRVFAGGFQ